jgi:hypothetical protein
MYFKPGQTDERQVARERALTSTPPQIIHYIDDVKESFAEVKDVTVMLIIPPKLQSPVASQVEFSMIINERWRKTYTASWRMNH